MVTASVRRRVAGELGTPPFRFDCAPENFSIIVTKKRSMRFYEIQGPVCVDGLVLRFSVKGRSEPKSKITIMEL